MESKSKYKYLIKNMGLLTLSSFATKLLSFFLVPLYTSVLSTAEYGIYDLFNTTIGLLIPILTIDIQEAVLRYALDKDQNPNDVFKIGAKFFWIGSAIVSILIGLNYFIGGFSILQRYSIQFLVMYATSSLNGIVCYYARGVGDVKEISISGVLASIVSISCNIVFLLGLKIGLLGYFYATILGSTFQILYLCTRLHVWKNVFPRRVNTVLQRDMIQYSSPMVANAISWWVNNASDRYVVTGIAGIAANGIYSVSYKIPSIISVLQSIFGQAWSISAVEELDIEDKSGFYINVYNLYNFILVFSCSGLIFLNKPIAKILFANEFYQAWEYSPFLMISVVFSGMSAFVGGLFSALKKSKAFAQTSVVTAIVNTVGNIILVFLMGPLGAAISTAASYFLMWLLRIRLIRKDINLRVNFKRDLLSYLILTIQAVLLLEISKDSIFTWYQLSALVIIMLMYKNEIMKLLDKFATRKKL